jgi:hypothetical protein
LLFGGGEVKTKREESDEKKKRFKHGETRMIKADPRGAKKTGGPSHWDTLSRSTRPSASLEQRATR